MAVAPFLKRNDMDEIPSWLNRLDPEAPKQITQDQRDKLIWFNTERYWHCYYDPSNDHLYDQYCCLIKENAYQYLLDLGHIDKDRNALKHFSK